MSTSEATELCQNTAREEVLRLMKKKENVEEEIKQLHQVLESQQDVGMNGALVDREGYPRNDIDVYQVRHARNRIICLQNDHKSLMKEIEAGLHAVHSQTRGDEIKPDLTRHTTQDVQDRSDSLKPFVRVDTVSPNSPAYHAGLLLGDLIVSFGSVTSDNYRDLQNIGAVVQHSVGKSISVRVRRERQTIRLSLTPSTWSGRGLLGCNIVPV
jgi:26S proteasome non-ATPase regulatory subunit 9